MTMRTLDKRATLTLCALTILALVLRCLYLSRQSLWLDELVSWTCSMRDFWGALYCDINKPPLYYPLLHYWRDMFGSSEAAMRALSIPPGVASVWLIYLLGARMFSRPIGYIAAGYMTVAPFQVYFAQEARNYTWLVFFLLMAGLFLWEAVEADSRKARIWCWAGYAASITLALYTHYFAAFFIAGHGLYILFRQRQQLLAASISTAAAMALVAPFILIFLRSPQASESHLHRFPLLKVPQAYFSFLFSDSLIPMDDIATRHLRETLVAYAGVGILVLVSLGILAWFGWRAAQKWREPMIFATWHGVAPVLVAFAVSLKVNFFDRRYVIPSSPYIYLLTAAAVWEVVTECRKTSQPRWRLLAGVAATGVLGILISLSLHQYYASQRFGKEQWRDAIAYIEASSSADGRDLLVLDPDYLSMCYRYYQKRTLTYWAMTPEAERAAAGSSDMIRERARGYHRVWLVYSHNTNEDLLGSLKRLYAEESVREFPLSNRIQVYAFRTGD